MKCKLIFDFSCIQFRELFSWIKGFNQLNSGSSSISTLNSLPSGMKDSSTTSPLLMMIESAAMSPSICQIKEMDWFRPLEKDINNSISI